jgi:hypothetical protein
MYKFEHYLLGETDENHLMETSEESVLASLKMAQQAKRTINIISRNLDPIIYDTPEFVDAVKYMVLKSKNNRVRILVQEPEQIVKRGHRLLNLSMILTSFIEMRVPSKEHSSYNEALFIADQSGYLYRKNSARYEGQLNFNDNRRSRILIHEFDEIWEKSRTNPNLKRTLI